MKLLEPIKNCISSLFCAANFDIHLQKDRDILKYIQVQGVVGHKSVGKCWPQSLGANRNNSFWYD